MSKVAIVGDPSGTGTLTIAAPNTSTDRTLTLPDAAGTLDRLERAGNVLQVVSATSATQVSTSSGSPVDTLLAATITPSSSTNKVLVLVSSVLRATAAISTDSAYVWQKIWRGAIGSGTLIHDGYPIMGGKNTDIRGVGSVMTVDSPATTSAVTYRVSIQSNHAAAVYINATTNPSFITLLEIAA